jgi:hypothetical protein
MRMTEPLPNCFSIWAGSAQKDQGEMDILGVGRAPGPRGQGRLDPGEGQTLGRAGPEGQEEALSHRHRHRVIQ